MIFIQYLWMLLIKNLNKCFVGKLFRTSSLILNCILFRYNQSETPGRKRISRPEFTVWRPTNNPKVQSCRPTNSMEVQNYRPTNSLEVKNCGHTHSLEVRNWSPCMVIFSVRLQSVSTVDWRPTHRQEICGNCMHTNSIDRSRHE